jgi:hypothetical protein
MPLANVEAAPFRCLGPHHTNPSQHVTYMEDVQKPIQARAGEAAHKSRLIRLLNVLPLTCTSSITCTGWGSIDTDGALGGMCKALTFIIDGGGRVNSRRTRMHEVIAVGPMHTVLPACAFSV